MIKGILSTLQDDAGASLLEYALIILLVAIVSIAGLKVLGNATSASLSASAGSIAP